MNLKQWARATCQTLANRPAAERHQHYTNAQVEEVLRMSITTLIEALASGDELRIDAFGRLWVEEKQPQRVVNNLNGKPQEHELPVRKMVRFRASSRLVAQVSKATSTNNPQSPEWFLPWKPLARPSENLPTISRMWEAGINTRSCGPWR